jgi:hypothetical protein
VIWSVKLKKNYLELGTYFHNEELHKFYSSPNIIRMIKEVEMGRVCSTNGI